MNFWQPTVHLKHRWFFWGGSPPRAPRTNEDEYAKIPPHPGPPPPSGAAGTKPPEKGHFLGIFGQKTPKKALKIYFDPKMFKIFPGRSLETSKNAKKKFRPPSMFSALVNTCCTGYFLAFEAHVWSAAKYSHTDFWMKYELYKFTWLTHCCQFNKAYSWNLKV